MDVVCEMLFAGSITSDEVTRVFEEKFKDRPVQWEGTLDSAARTVFDLVFGDNPCTKATFQLKEIDDGIISHTIRAMVAFPEDAEEELKACVGQRLTFTGKLVGCDLTMRNLFVANGSLA